MEVEAKIQAITKKAIQHAKDNPISDGVLDLETNEDVSDWNIWCKGVGYAYGMRKAGVFSEIDYWEYILKVAMKVQLPPEDIIEMEDRINNLST